MIMPIFKKHLWQGISVTLLISLATPAQAEMGRRSNICGSWNNNCSAPARSYTPPPPSPGKTPSPPKDDGGIQAEKNEAAYRERQARLAFLAGRWDQAVDHAQRCLGNDLNNKYCAFVAAEASYQWDLDRLHITDYTALNYERLEHHIYNYERAVLFNPNTPGIQTLLQGLKNTLAQRQAEIEAHDPYIQNRKNFQQASDYYNAKDYAKAATYYREAIRWDARDMEAHQWLGWSLYLGGKYQESMDAFRNAIALGLKDSNVFRKMMYLTFDNKPENESLSDNISRLESALGYAKQLQSLKPDDMYAHKIEGNILVELGRRSDAAIAYQQALAIEPNNESALTAALKNSFENYDYDQAGMYVDRLEAVCPTCTAVKTFKTAIAAKKLSHQFLAKYKNSEASPEMVDHYFSFGDIEGITTASKDIDRYTAALKEARTRIERHPNDARAYEAQSLALAELWRADEALASMEQALALTPNNVDMLLRAMEYAEGAQTYQKAMQYADRADQLRPGTQTLDAWIERLIHNELNDIRYGIEAYPFDLAPQTMRPGFRTRVLNKSLSIVREGLQWEPDDPKLLALQTELVNAQTAFEQAKATAKHSQSAAQAKSMEEAKHQAMIGFDTAGTESAPTPVPTGQAADPVVSDTTRTITITVFEQKRAELREQKHQQEKSLAAQEQAASPDPMALASLKQSISTLDSHIHFLNFSIEEELRKAKITQTRDTLNKPGQSSRRETNTPDVTEMSVGGEALSPQDQTISEQQLAEKRKLWVADTRAAVRRYIERREHYNAIERQVMAEIAHDPQLKQAVEESDRLWKAAETEYARQQQAPDHENDGDAKLLEDAALGVRYWPGEANPEAPLPNPIDEEAKRFRAVSEIYGKLKERQRLLNIFERMADEMEAGDD